MRQFVLLLLVASFSVSLFAQTDPRSDDSDVAALQRLIDSCGYNWVAGHTTVSDLSPEQKQQLLGYYPSKAYQDWLAQQPRIAVDPKLVFPTRFDWRDSGVMTPVKNQGGCGSCWDFAATAAFEAAVKKHDGIEYDLSEQQVLSCNIYGQGASCDGGTADAVFDLFTRYGAVLESCMPYQANDNVLCIQAQCPVVARAGGCAYAENDVNAIKQIVLRGPTTTGFMVYNDFFYYTSGCYRHTSGGVAGGHIVVIVGWDDDACGSGSGAWLCKNSWGPGWGALGGYFWIKWGDCGIGDGVVQPIYPAPPVVLNLDYFLISDSLGDNDGVIDANESVNLRIFVVNRGTAWADGVEAVLRCRNTEVRLIDSIVYLSYLGPDQIPVSPNQQFKFNVDSSASRGTRLDFELQISSYAGVFWDTLYDYVGHFDTLFFDDMEVCSNAWTHGGRFDKWECGPPVRYSLIDADTAHSGVNVRGIDLDAGYRPNCDQYLESPVINCWNVGFTKLRFYRWLSSEKGSWDHARIRVNGKVVWENSRETDQLDLNWTYQDIDISAVADFRPSVRVRFEMLSDYGAELGGWNIDDFAIAGISGLILGDVYSDGDWDLKDAVYLINFIFIGGPAPEPLRIGDANCDGTIDISDPVYLISYIFSSGAAPGCR